MNLFQRLRAPLPVLEDYYRQQRKERFERGERPGRVRLRAALYPVFAGVLRLDRLFRRQKVILLNRPPRGKGPVIFACTHIAQNDLENIYEKLGRGCWWFVGDPCVLYKEISGLLLYLNGCIFLELTHKEDRHIAYLRALELLRRGGSLMIFPEGARNNSENLPVMGLFPGAAKLATETGTRVVPVAVEQYGRRFVINFGNALLPGEFPGIDSLTRAIRDALAALKWEIWEREGIQCRAALPDDAGERFSREFEERIAPYDTLETVERSKFRRKTTSPQEAFAHLRRLVPCRENAFLFRGIVRAVIDWPRFTSMRPR